MYHVMKDLIKNWLTQIKKGYLDLCILSLIETKKKSYGFEIISLLSEVDVVIKEGTLYPLLSRMTKDGLLVATWHTEEVLGHPRKFYSLTKLGKVNLKKMKTEYQNLYETYDNIKEIGASNEQT